MRSFSFILAILVPCSGALPAIASESDASAFDGTFVADCGETRNCIAQLEPTEDGEFDLVWDIRGRHADAIPECLLTARLRRAPNEGDPSHGNVLKGGLGPTEAYMIVQEIDPGRIRLWTGKPICDTEFFNNIYALEGDL